MPKNRLAANPDERKFQARMDLDTLNRAIEIQKDKSRMTAVGQLAKEQMEALARHVGKDDMTPKSGPQPNPKPSVHDGKRGDKSPAPPAPKRSLARQDERVRDIPVERKRP